MPLGSLLGGFIGQQGALQAGAASGAAGIRAYQNAQEEAAKNRAATSPWTATGGGAEDMLARLYGLGHITYQNNDPRTSGTLDKSNVAGDRTAALNAFQASPGYQFRLGEGIKALDRSAAAKGMLLSGAQQRAVTDYGQNTASNEFGNYSNALMGLSGGGLNAALGTNATNAGVTNQGNALGFSGAMGQASAYSNAANALASGISNGMNNLASLAGYTGFGKDIFKSV